MELGGRNGQVSLNLFIDLAINLDNFIHNLPAYHATANSVSMMAHHKPIQIAWAVLSLAEYERRRKGGAMFLLQGPKLLHVSVPHLCEEHHFLPLRC